MKRNQKIALVLALVVLVAALAVMVLLYRDHLIRQAEAGWRPNDETLPVGTLQDDESMESEPVIHISDEEVIREGKYVCPECLKDAITKNPDVYAWISVTDTEISYPVCNRPNDNSFYLNHSDKLLWDPFGALFTEDYNARDFSDPAVVIYGHSMTGKRFFGTLQKDYSSEEFFQNHREIKVYLEDELLTYTIFAAFPYTNTHLLYYFDFSRLFYYNAFIDSIYHIRSIDAKMDEELRPEFGEKLLILSTCLKGNNDKRFLVIAKQNET